MIFENQCSRRTPAGIRIIALLAIAAALIACGASAPHAERLDGNWQITGDPTASTDPAISVVLYGTGGQITGTAVAVVQCANEPTTRRMVNLQLNGQVNQDGTYTVASSTDGYGDVLNLNGPMPRSGQQSWSGSYSLYASLSDPTTALTCLLKPTASFQAVAITPLNGTYSGSITGNHLSSDATIGVQITQEATLAGLAGYDATASLSVTGSSCFKAGSQVLADTAAISGDSITLHFKMDDGSQVDFYGLTNAAANKITGTLAVDGGKCIYDADSGVLQHQ
jgi:hypothetical protein